MLNSKKVIKESNIKFGTSGARGLVNDFKPEVCAAFVYAFIDEIAKHFSFDTVAIAIDTRPSSYLIAQACVQAIDSIGLKSIYYGVIPTPALANQALQDKIPAIMVTGSHISFDRNGLKFYRPDGEISKTNERSIVEHEILFNLILSLPKLTVFPVAAQRYIERYTNLFTDDLLVGKRVGIYEHSSAGRDLYTQIFRQLGAEVISISRSNKFVPIDTEAIAVKDQLKARKWAYKYNLDAIFSTDGDGDRPLVADENGKWICGDILSLLCAKSLSVEAIAVPLSCNTAVSKSNLFTHIEFTKVGSPYVIEALTKLSSKYARIAGFEPNGGFLLGSDINFGREKITALPTRDAILPFLVVFSSAVKNGVSLSDLVYELPLRFTSANRIQNFPLALSKNLICNALHNPLKFVHSIGVNLNIKDINNMDGVRIILIDDSVIHFRPSGNSPEMRCYAESSSLEEANLLVNKMLTHFKNKM